jgi:hypothetical protein
VVEQPGEVVQQQRQRGAGGGGAAGAAAPHPALSTCNRRQQVDSIKYTVLHRRLHGVDTACSLQVVWWVVVILALISLGLTLLGPWTPTGSV